MKRSAILNESSWQDYRESHLNKGVTYDENLGQGGMDTYMAVREKEILTFLISKLFTSGIPRYLDFACGTGRIVHTVEQMAEDSYGVDISAQMLQQAREKCKRTEFLHCDITREGLQIPPMNLVSAFRFFGNAQNELRLEVIRAIHAILDDDGYFILNNHQNAYSVRRMLHYCLGKRGRKSTSGLSYGELKRLLTSNGFIIRRAYGIGFWMIRDKFCEKHVLQSRIAQILEPFSTTSYLARFCPDYIVVAQKKA